MRRSLERHGQLSPIVVFAEGDQVQTLDGFYAAARGDRPGRVATWQPGSGRGGGDPARVDRAAEHLVAELRAQPEAARAAWLAKKRMMLAGNTHKDVKVAKAAQSRCNHRADQLGGHARSGRRSSPFSGTTIDKDDVELIVIVIERSRELGLGNDLFESHVAELTKAERTRLWLALAPVVDITCGFGTVDGVCGDITSHPELIQLGESLRGVAAKIGCDSLVADAFLVTDDEFYNRHTVGGIRALHRAIHGSAVGHLEQLFRKSPRAHRAMTEMLRVLTQELCSYEEAR